MSPSTMHDRVKNTGYLMGPGHKYGASMDQGSDAGPDDGSSDQSAPPNLRDAADMPLSCQDCEHYQPGGEQGGTCAKFNNSPVKPNEVCDVGFEARGGDSDEESTPQESNAPEEIG